MEDTVQIKSIYNQNDVLEIYQMPGHDMWINTIRLEKDDFMVGHTARIYSWAGSMSFADLHENLLKAHSVSDNINQIELLSDPGLDVQSMEKTELIESVADEFVLAIFRDNVGHIDIQTRHATYANMAVGPVVWLCGPVKENTSDVFKKRSELFLPIFDLTKKLADKINRPVTE